MFQKPGMNVCRKASIKLFGEWDTSQEVDVKHGLHDNVGAIITGA